MRIFLCMCPDGFGIFLSKLSPKVDMFLRFIMIVKIILQKLQDFKMGAWSCNAVLNKILIKKR